MRDTEKHSFVFAFLEECGQSADLLAWEKKNLQALEGGKKESVHAGRDGPQKKIRKRGKGKGKNKDKKKTTSPAPKAAAAKNESTSELSKNQKKKLKKQQNAAAAAATQPSAPASSPSSSPAAPVAPAADSAYTAAQWEAFYAGHLFGGQSKGAGGGERQGKEGKGQRR